MSDAQRRRFLIAIGALPLVAHPAFARNLLLRADRIIE